MCIGDWRGVVGAGLGEGQGQQGPGPGWMTDHRVVLVGPMP